MYLVCILYILIVFNILKFSNIINFDFLKIFTQYINLFNLNIDFLFIIIICFFTFFLNKKFFKKSNFFKKIIFLQNFFNFNLMSFYFIISINRHNKFKTIKISNWTPIFKKNMYVELFTNLKFWKW